MQMEQAARRAAEEALAQALQRSTAPPSPPSNVPYPLNGSPGICAELLAMRAELQQAQAAVARAEALIQQFLEPQDNTRPDQSINIPKLTSSGMPYVSPSVGESFSTSTPLGTTPVVNVQGEAPSLLEGCSHDLGHGEPREAAFPAAGERTAWAPPGKAADAGDVPVGTLKPIAHRQQRLPRAALNREDRLAKPEPSTTSRRQKEPWHGQVGGRMTERGLSRKGTGGRLS